MKNTNKIDQPDNDKKKLLFEGEKLNKLQKYASDSEIKIPKNEINKENIKFKKNNKRNSFFDNLSQIKKERTNQSFIPNLKKYAESKNIPLKNDFNNLLNLKNQNNNSPSEKSKEMSEEEKKQNKLKNEEFFKITEQKIQKFKQFLNSHDFKTKYILGDGDCLWRSFAHQMEGKQDNYKEYKRNAIDHIAANFSKFLEIEDDNELYILEHLYKMDDELTSNSKITEWAESMDLYVKNLI